MDPLALVLITVSMLTQGPIPVAQAGIKAGGLRDSARMVMITSTAGTILICLAVVAIDDLRFVPPPAVTPSLAALVVGAGLLYALANVLMVLAAFALGPPRFGIVFTLRIIPLAGISALTLGEPFTWFTTTGYVLVLAGVFMATRKRGHDALEKEDPAKGRPPIRAWALGVAATLAFGSANALDAAVVKEIEAVTYVPLRLMLPVLFIGVGLVLARACGLRKPPEERKAPPSWQWRQRWAWLVAFSIFMPVSATTFMWAVELTNQAGLLGAFHQMSLFPTIAITALAGDEWRWRELPHRLYRDVPRKLREYWAFAFVCCLGVFTAIGLSPLLALLEK